MPDEPDDPDRSNDSGRPEVSDDSGTSDRPNDSGTPERADSTTRHHHEATHHHHDDPGTPGPNDDSHDLTDAEKRALHEMQLGVEHVGRARGRLLDFHHEVGNAFDHFEAARELLREAGDDELADELRDRHLPAGVFDDRWTYELVDDFEDGVYAEITAFEADLRAELADGEPHVTERGQQAEWRRRAESEAWKVDRDDPNADESSRDGRAEGEDPDD